MEFQGVEVASKKRKEKSTMTTRWGAPGCEGERQVDAESAISFFGVRSISEQPKTCEGKERKEEQTLSGLGDP